MDSEGRAKRKLLVARVSGSALISRSGRLQDLLAYLAQRVLDENAEHIPEQEIGWRVFGRAPDYDTAADNIVRVHASTLRKRLEQFFADEGRDEPLVMEIPKGNYAPAFRERVAVTEPAVPAIPDVSPAPERAPAPPAFLIGFVLVLGALSAILGWQLWAERHTRVPEPASAVKAFWSAVFVPGGRTDIVLDDGALALYQELNDRPVALSSYFDRSYLRRLNETATGTLDRQTAEGILLKRYSSYAGANLLLSFAATAQALRSEATVHFARDYSYRELKANRSILLGTRWSNPWIETFESRVGLRWLFDKATATYYPTDTWAPAGQSGRYRPTGDHPDGYCSLSLVPNLGGTGQVLILSATGGAAASAAEAFLLDPGLLEQLRRGLPESKSIAFPTMEVLLRVPARSRLPKDCAIVICRSIK